MSKPTPTTNIPTCVNLQPIGTNAYTLNIDPGDPSVTLTLTNYSCNSILGVCVSSDKGTCKDVPPIIIWATDPTQAKIRMYLPNVGSIVARKITNKGLTYYGFVVPLYVLDTDQKEFDYDTKTSELSITDSGVKYSSAVMTAPPTTVGKYSYTTFVLAQPVSKITPITQAFLATPVAFVPSSKPIPTPTPSPPDDKKSTVLLSIVIGVSVIALLFIFLFVKGKIAKDRSVLSSSSST